MSERCMEILAEAERLKDSSGFIFTNGNGKPLSDATLSKLLREQKVDAVPHGFRSSFRVWASEQTSIPHQVSEFALAHVIGNKAEAAYQRLDLFEKRRKLMTMWTDYLDKTKASAEVVPIKRQVKKV